MKEIMTASQDKEARNILRKDVKGEYKMPGLDEFAVTVKTESVNDAWERYMKHQNEMYRQMGKLAL
jgi:hypothetical protein